MRMKVWSWGGKARRRIAEAEGRHWGESDRPLGEEDQSPMFMFQVRHILLLRQTPLGLLSRFSTLRVWCVVSFKIIDFGSSRDNTYHFFHSSHEEGNLPVKNVNTTP